MSLTINHFYQFGEFTLDTDQKVLLRAGRPVSLTPKAFDTLLVLVENGGRIVPKEDLMSRVWPDTFVEESNLTFNVKELRKTLGDDARRPRYIETVQRRGYRFIADVEEVLCEGTAAGVRHTHKLETKDTGAAVAGNGHAGGLRTRAGDQDLSPSASGGTARATRGDSLALGGDSDAGVAGGVEVAAVTRANRKPPGAGRKALAFAALAVLAVPLCAVGWLAWRRSAVRPEPADGRPMLAVLPFKNLTGDASQDYLSDGLTEEMIAQLGGLDPRRLGVIARTSVMHYKESPAPLDQIGRELGVEYVLEGSVRRDADDLRVTAQLIRVRDQSHLWAREYDRQPRGLLALQSEIAREIADQIQLTLTSGQPAQSAAQPQLSAREYEAYDLYLRGQFFWNKRTAEGFRQAIDYYQRALDKDPNYSRAYVGLADSYALVGGYSGRPPAESMQRARAAALRALELDDRSAEAHTALALVVQNYDWDWQTAEREFRRAIELNPNYATAHHWYAEHLMWRGRFDEALRESERARQLDPLSLIIAADNGAILYYSRQYDRAIERFRAVREMDPDFPRAGLIVAAYVEKGSFAEALADIERRRATLDDTWYWSSLAYIYGRSGQRAQARRALENLREINSRREVDAVAFITPYVSVGDSEQAFAWLEKAYSQHSNILTTLKVDPSFDPLRDDPRFKDLLRRVGLGD